MKTVEAKNTISCQVVSNHPAAKGEALNWTATYERVGDDILLIRNSIPRLDEIIGKSEKHAQDFCQATIIGDDLEQTNNADKRSCDTMSLSQDAADDMLFYGLLCRSVEGPYLGAYIEKVNEHAVVRVGSGYILLRYPEGGYYRTHVDVARDHPVLGHRRLSTVLFCNDDFDGGELIFPRQGVTIEPEAGKMVIFPSGFTHPHESTAITRGTKYAIVSWFY